MYSCVCLSFATEIFDKLSNQFHRRTIGKISAQPHTVLCIQFLDRENNDKNNTLSLGKQICFTIVWGCAETLPNNILYQKDFIYINQN